MKIPLMDPQPVTSHGPGGGGPFGKQIGLT